MQVFVQCYESYQNDIKNGFWLNIDGKDENEMLEEINEFLADSMFSITEPVTEFIITDYEGMPNLGKQRDLEVIEKYLGLLDSWDENLVWMLADDYCSGDLDTVERYLDERYYGHWNDIEEYAADYISNCYSIPSGLENYIDYEKFANDLVYGGDIFTIDDGEGGVYIFTNY